MLPFSQEGHNSLRGFPRFAFRRCIRKCSQLVGRRPQLLRREVRVTLHHQLSLPRTELLQFCHRRKSSVASPMYHCTKFSTVEQLGQYYVNPITEFQGLLGEAQISIEAWRRHLQRCAPELEYSLSKINARAVARFTGALRRRREPIGACARRKSNQRPYGGSLTREFCPRAPTQGELLAPGGAWL